MSGYLARILERNDKDGERMRPNERRRIAERVARKFRESRHDLTIEEINEDVVPLETLFDDRLTGIDKHFLEDVGVQP